MTQPINPPERNSPAKAIKGEGCHASLPSARGQGIASPGKKRGRPRKIPGSETRMHAFEISIPLALYDCVQARRKLNGFTASGVVADALYFFLLGAKRRPVMGARELVARDMRRLTEVVAYLENRVEDIDRNLGNSLTTDPAKLSLGIDIPEFKTSLRALRHQLALHLSQLPKPGPRNGRRVPVATDKTEKEDAHDHE